MLKSNKDLMADARSILKGNWGSAVAGCVVYFFISIAIGVIPVAGWIAGIVISGPLTVGLYLFFLDFGRGAEPRINRIFDGFSTFRNSIPAYILVVIFTVLWTILLIVPGIMAALSYSMTFFILADNPQTDALKAIRLSKQMMFGNRWKMFCLGCRFIGWFLLGILSIGIGFLWIFPYFIVSFTRFYEDLRISSSGEGTTYTGVTVNGKPV